MSQVKLFLALISILFINYTVNSQQYPFDLPNTIKATFNVETNKKEKFKNQLLGYNIEGFNTNLQKDFVRKFDPISIRFPHGVWANFYNWKTDGYQQDNYDNGIHQTALDIYVNRLKGHIKGIEQLNSEKKIKTGKGFHMMWTYSMNFDDVNSSLSRIKKDLNSGFEVKDIELGNEHFWKNQRSNQTKTAHSFLNRARSVADAIKKEYPNIRVSIPLSWRRSHGDYNRIIADDAKYFDAASIHVYTGADPDKPGQSDIAYSKLLTARLNLASNVNWVRNSFAKNKPVWLTEWGVSGGKDVHAAACLGMADVYLFMSENQHIYDRANWFSFNRVLNAMVEVGQDREPIFPLKKRGYLSTYEILADVLKDGTMFKGTMSTAKLNSSDGRTNAINARIVTKNGKTSALVVNLTNSPVEFILKLNGTIYKKTFKHEALVFNNLGVVKSIPVDKNPLKLIKNGSGKIILPPLSISKISKINLNTNT